MPLPEGKIGIGFVKMTLQQILPTTMTHLFKLTQQSTSCLVVFHLKLLYIQKITAFHVVYK